MDILYEHTMQTGQIYFYFYFFALGTSYLVRTREMILPGAENQLLY